MFNCLNGFYQLFYRFQLDFNKWSWESEEDADGTFTIRECSPDKKWNMWRNQKWVSLLTQAYQDFVMDHVKIICVHASTGTSGATIKLAANFFRILSRPQWVLYQYHIDFKPPMESRRLRSALLFQHAEMLGSARSFDGAQLFLPHRLHSKVAANESIQFHLQWVIQTLTGSTPTD